MQLRKNWKLGICSHHSFFPLSMQLRKNWKLIVIGFSPFVSFVSMQLRKNWKYSSPFFLTSATASMQLRKNWKTVEFAFEEGEGGIDATQKELKEKELKEQENYVIHLLSHSEDVT